MSHTDTSGYDAASTTDYQQSPSESTMGPDQQPFDQQSTTNEQSRFTSHSSPSTSSSTSMHEDGPVIASSHGNRFGTAFSSFTSSITSHMPTALTSLELPSSEQTDSYFRHQQHTSTTTRLRKVLGWKELISLGVGCTIGAGIFVVTGVVAATKAGPALFLCYLVSGFACCLAGLCYAELAAMAPTAGSAYSYARASLGQTIGWIIGWDLTLEYAVSGASVAQGWSKYFNALLHLMGMSVPAGIAQAPWMYDPDTGAFTATGAVFDLPACVITLLITWILVRGVRESAKFATAMVILKVAIVFFVILIGMFYMSAANFDPFMPYGFLGISFFGYTAFGQTGPDGSPVGVFAGAAIVFFAYIGFDSVTCQAEETANPQRDLPIGIIGSLAISTVLYVAVSLVLVGMVPYGMISLDAPLSDAFGLHGLHWAEFIIALGALVGITSVLLVTIMGQPRILMSMARDGLLPESFFAAVHPTYATPYKSTILTGIVVAVMSSLIPLSVLVELVSIGTLLAFTIVCISIIILRRTAPNIPRPFLCPYSPYVPGLGAFACLMLMLSLPSSNWLRLIVWLGIGMIIYISYGYKNSKLVAEQRERERNSDSSMSDRNRMLSTENGVELVETRQPLPLDSDEVSFGAHEYARTNHIDEEEINPFDDHSTVGLKGNEIPANSPLYGTSEQSLLDQSLISSDA